MTVCEQRKVVNSQTLLEVRLKFLMLNTHIGKPMAFPKRRNLFKYSSIGGMDDRVTRIRLPISGTFPSLCSFQRTMAKNGYSIDATSLTTFCTQEIPGGIDEVFKGFEFKNASYAKIINCHYGNFGKNLKSRRGDK